MNDEMKEKAEEEAKIDYEVKAEDEEKQVEYHDNNYKQKINSHLLSANFNEIGVSRFGFETEKGRGKNEANGP